MIKEKQMYFSKPVSTLVDDFIRYIKYVWQRTKVKIFHYCLKYFSKTSKCLQKKAGKFLVFFLFCRLKNSHESTLSKVIERNIEKID
jgi:hypothetical protein